MHTLHGILACHVNDGVIVAMAEVVMPSLKVWGASGIVGCTGGCRRMGMPNVGQKETEPK
jgi:hypothetical protein